MVNSRYIVVFDGVCNFCNGAVNFIIKRDPAAKFLFAPMQTDAAKELIAKYAPDSIGVDTFMLIKHDQCFRWSTAALEISKDLGGFWWALNVLKLIPAPIRNFFYRLFARNRYTLFGRTRQCMVPSKELSARFIGV